MTEQDSSDPKFWKWSIFYYNPRDEHRFVPRRDGLGLSFNFAHNTPYIIIGGSLIVVLALVLYNLNLLKF